MIGKVVERTMKKPKYVMAGKLKSGATAPLGGVVKTKNGHVVKKTK